MHPTPLRPGEACRVFVTSATYDGNLGGLAGADAKCDERAAESGWPGTYRACLSDGTYSPGTRFVRNPVPYQFVNGTTIEANWADLTDGTLDAALNRNEWGDVVAPGRVWTNTNSNGSGASSGHCENWTIDLSVPYWGATGSAFSTDKYWTEGGLAVCDSSGSLYCFQQG